MASSVPSKGARIHHSAWKRVTYSGCVGRASASVFANVVFWPRTPPFKNNKELPFGTFRSLLVVFFNSLPLKGM